MRDTDVRIDYNNRLFQCVGDNPAGDVSRETVFHYRQVGTAVWATYSGGEVICGTMVGIQRDDNRLDLRYQHVTCGGSLRSGRCMSTPVMLADGRIRLREVWSWSEGGIGSGMSEVEELQAEVPDSAVPRTLDRQSSEHYIWGAQCEGWRFLDRPDVTVTLERMSPRTAEVTHLHRRARQVFFVLKGRLHVDGLSGPFDVPAESALEVPPGQIHTVRNTASADAIFLVVSVPSTRMDRVDLPERAVAPIDSPSTSGADA